MKDESQKDPLSDREELEADRVEMMIMKDPTDTSDVIFALNEVSVTQVKRGVWVTIPRYKAEYLQKLESMVREQDPSTGLYTDTFQPKYSVSIRELAK